MKLKRTLLMGFLGIALSIPAMAQEKVDGKERPRPRPRTNQKEMLENMKEKLQLSDDQTKKIEGIFNASREEMQKLREESAGNREQNREKFMELRKKQQEDIHAVLTEDQREKLKEMREERSQHRRPRPRKRMQPKE